MTLRSSACATSGSSRRPRPRSPSARRTFEDAEHRWLEATAARAAEKAAAAAREESTVPEDFSRDVYKDGHGNETEEVEEYGYVEDGPAEIIWQGNEITVKKNKAKVPKKAKDKQPIQQLSKLDFTQEERSFYMMLEEGSRQKFKDPPEDAVVATCWRSLRMDRRDGGGGGNGIALISSLPGLRQFRKEKGPGKKAKAKADAETEEGSSKSGAEAEEAVPEPKSPVGLKLLAGESGGSHYTPFEEARRLQVEQCNGQEPGTVESSTVDNTEVLPVQEGGDDCNAQDVGDGEGPAIGATSADGCGDLVEGAQPGEVDVGEKLPDCTLNETMESHTSSQGGMADDDDDNQLGEHQQVEMDPVKIPTSSDFKELTEATGRIDQLGTLNIQLETEVPVLRDGLAKLDGAVETSRAELHKKDFELEQMEHKLSSVKEKLSIAVANGKGLIVQRDNLKQTLLEKSGELEKLLHELQSKDALLIELESKIKSYADADRIEALESELSYIRNSATALRDSFLQKDSILQRIEENDKVSPAAVVTQIRGARKVNTDQVAIDVEVQKDKPLDDEDDDKAYGFKSLTISHIVPKFTRPISDRIDGMCRHRLHLAQQATAEEEDLLTLAPSEP
ncbi:hypothetical protein ABZP36_023464 [Zizania latifolia]